MSTLQLTLAIIGGLVLGAVVAQGVWVSRQNKPMQADPKSKGALSDASLERTEPTLEGIHGANEDSKKDDFEDAHQHASSSSELRHDLAAGAQSDLGQTQALSSDQSLDFEVSQSLVQSERRYALDALIDVIANIELDNCLLYTSPSPRDS